MKERPAQGRILRILMTVRMRDHMKPEDETKRRVHKVFDMKNLAEMSRRTGYHTETLRRWKNNPLSIKMVDLLRLEQKTGVAK